MSTAGRGRGETALLLVLTLSAVAVACRSGVEPPAAPGARDDVCAAIARGQTELPGSFGYRGDCYRVTVCAAPGAPFSGVPASAPYEGCPAAIFSTPRAHVIPDVDAALPTFEGQTVESSRGCVKGSFDAEGTRAARATCPVACCYDERLACTEPPAGRDYQ